MGWHGRVEIFSEFLSRTLQDQAKFPHYSVTIIDAFLLGPRLSFDFEAISAKFGIQAVDQAHSVYLAFRPSNTPEEMREAAYARISSFSSSFSSCDDEVEGHNEAKQIFQRSTSCRCRVHE